MIYWVKTNTSIEYIFEATRFEIFDGIIHFYDENGVIIWVIKDWTSFCQNEEKKKCNNPDEFYENLKDE